MSTFVLIPKTLYDSKFSKQSVEEVNPVSDQESYNNSKIQLLEQSNYTNQLIPFIPPPPPIPKEIPEINKEEAEKKQEILVGTKFPAGPKLKRSISLLDKFYKHPKLSLSADDTILIDSSDTEINLSALLNKIQNKTQGLLPIEQDILSLLSVKKREVAPWVTIK